ncbi:oligosaccharide flippase family protein [Alkalinema sp. FACHB-956]|uniref:oligosaccharide flippase family protein n=1 Tax=Alkalinema sp. FACHB-956 TaxID=2692768 RepID=UPI0016854EC1|nr:oligosaccharide flippase family protein [Alkalinema sp. FACHB-956]MBD2329066.1 oligosaccharide flippase family protein [Alkalinema sp. FACHB-956]
MSTSYLKAATDKIRTLLQQPSSLKQLVLQGALWSVGLYGLSTIIRLISSMIMTRLLFPELFGLMSLVQTIIVGLFLFSDLGTNATVVRHEQGDDPELLNTIWTVKILRGCILWVFCCLLAQPAATLYQEPRLVWLLPVMGLSCILDGLGSTAIYTLTRHLEVRRLSLYSLQTQLIVTVLSIAIAWFTRNIWALVLSQLLNMIVLTVSSHLLIPNYRNRFAWNRFYLKELLSFGKWILLSTILTFGAGQIDRFLLGKLLSWQVLGIYGVALSISDIPRNVVTNLSDKVIFPAVAQLLSLPRTELRTKLLKNRRGFLLTIAVGFSAFVCLGDLPILILYDQRYAEGAWMLPILALGWWPNVLAQSSHPILIALGKPQYQTWGNTGKLLWTGFGLPFGFAHWGILGVIVVIALNDIPLYLATAYGLVRENLNVIWQDVAISLTFLVTLFGLVWLRYTLGLGFPLERLFSTQNI